MFSLTPLQIKLSIFAVIAVGLMWLFLKYIQRDIVKQGLEVKEGKAKINNLEFMKIMAGE